MSDQFQIWSKLEVSSAGRILQLPARKLADFHCTVRFSNDVDQVFLQVIDLLVLLGDMDPSISATQAWEKIHTTARSKPNEQLAHAMLDITFRPTSLACEDFLRNVYRLGETLRARDPETRAQQHLSPPTDDLRWLETRLRGLRGKVVFTAVGHIGITVSDVADGLGLPAVLCRTGSKGSDAEEFKLVGFAYLDGVFDNEFEDPDLIAEILRLEKRTYHVC